MIFSGLSSLSPYVLCPISLYLGLPIILLSPSFLTLSYVHLDDGGTDGVCGASFIGVFYLF